jgi:hypothetical protein
MDSSSPLSHECTSAGMFPVHLGHYDYKCIHSLKGIPENPPGFIMNPALLSYRFLHTQECFSLSNSIPEKPAGFIRNPAPVYPSRASGSPEEIAVGHSEALEVSERSFPGIITGLN